MTLYRKKIEDKWVLVNANGELVDADGTILDSLDEPVEVATGDFDLVEEWAAPWPSTTGDDTDDLDWPPRKSRTGWWLAAAAALVLVGGGVAAVLGWGLFGGDDEAAVDNVELPEGFRVFVNAGDNNVLWGKRGDDDAVTIPHAVTADATTFAATYTVEAKELVFTCPVKRSPASPPENGYATASDCTVVQEVIEG